MYSESDKRKMIYFSLLCLIFTIIVISGTYAYFSAKKTVDDVVIGESATVSFGLAVEKVTTIDNEKGLIPMDDDVAELAAKSRCEDDLGYAICQIYKITVTNTGNTSMYLDGYVELQAIFENEMRFTRVYYDGDNFCVTENCTDEFDNSNIKTGVSSKTGSFNREEDYNALLVTSEKENEDELLDSGSSKDYYAMVWIHNKNESQNELQGMQNVFSGSVTFVSAQGNEVTAIFE